MNFTAFKLVPIRRSDNSSFVGGRGVTSLILCAIFLVSLVTVDWDASVFHDGGISSVILILQGMVELDLSPEFLGIAIEASWITITYAFAAISLAMVIAVPLSFVASGSLFESVISKIVGISMIRVLLAVVRSIHELIWAWLLAIALGFTPTAGVMALAIPYSAILARVFADFLNDVPDSPLNALRSSGASPFQVLIYGRIPLAAKDILSYAFYRFECCLRSAAVLSFIGLQGIGYQIMVSLDDVNFGQVWTLLIFLVAMVVLIDHWGSQIRRNLFS